MMSNRGKDTSPELALRKRLHGLGARFRKHRRPLPGVRCEADLLFPRVKLAVFVDGCFWHGCPEHTSYPITNREWWLRKLEGNKSRDRKNDEMLRLAGWTIVRLWEHQGVEEMAAEVLHVLTALRGGPRKVD